MVPLLKGHLFENAKMNVVLPYTQIMDTAVREQEIKRTIAKEKSLAGYYDFPFENDEFGLLEIIKGNSGPVTFGEAVIKDGILQKQSCFLSVLMNFLKLMTGIMMYMLITVRRRFKPF